MNKSELVKAVATQSGQTQAQVGETVDALLGVITDQLKSGEQVILAGFGTFKAKHREARTGRNPRTGEPVDIPEKTTAAWTPSPALKDL